MMPQSPGNVVFLKHAMRIHAARCRPSMAENGFKKTTLPGDYDRGYIKFNQRHYLR